MYIFLTSSMAQAARADKYLVRLYRTLGWQTYTIFAFSLHQQLVRQTDSIIILEYNDFSIQMGTVSPLDRLDISDPAGL